MDALTSHQTALLSQPEAALTIARLSDGEKIALLKVARLFARSVHADYLELLREAVSRVLAGTKAWPRKVNAVEFLSGAIRSIAWDWKNERSRMTAGVDAKGAAVPRAGDAVGEVNNILALFDHDEAGRRIVAAMMSGAKVEQIETISGLDRAGYEVKRTDIRRRIENFFAAER